MKQCLLIVLSTFLITSYADDNQIQIGTPDNPTINGVPYVSQQGYIEANQATIANSSQEPGKNTPIKSHSNSQSPISNNFKSDSWATDERVERALKQAASEGKLDYVLGKAKEKNLPATVAVVPIVESNYNKNAVSPKGAGGAWQIMPKTAAGYGVESKQRFDFERSTNLALTILNDLHEKFGNWQLAFAAYNCGDQCVINALRKNPTATSVNELSLPQETKNYVNNIMQINTVLTKLSINDNATKK